MRYRWSLWIATIAIVAAGCVRAGAADAPLASATAGAAAVGTAITTDASPSAAASAQPSAPPASDITPKIEHAIEMRRGARLRHDAAYVIASMTDPRAAMNLLDFPLYPEEEAKLLADQADQQRAVSVIQAYAAQHVDEYGGVYIDRDQHPGIVTALWTGHLAHHLEAIGASLEGGFVIVRQVRWTKAYLRGIQDDIVADLDWLATIPAAHEGVGVHISANRLFFEVSSAEPRAVELIRAHYGLGDEAIVTSDGTGAELIPAGTVKGRVVRPDGKRLGENELMLDYEGDLPGRCGGGDMGFGIRNDGTFEYPCQAGVRTILVKKNIADGEWKTIGRGTVTVVAHKTVKLTIHLTEAP